MPKSLPKNIHILEELDISGGSMDGGHTPHAAAKLG